MQGNDAATMAWPVAGGAKPPVTHAYWRKSAQVLGTGFVCEPLHHAVHSNITSITPTRLREPYLRVATEVVHALVDHGVLRRMTCGLQWVGMIRKHAELFAHETEWLAAFDIGCGQCASSISSYPEQGSPNPLPECGVARNVLLKVLLSIEVAHQNS